MSWKRVAALKTVEGLRAYLRELDVALELDDEVDGSEAAPLAKTYTLKSGKKIGNRFAILPMEGWDGTREGMPTGHTQRRWQRFGSSGAKLIFGGEAIAVRHDGRASPNQLLMRDTHLSGFEKLRDTLVTAHKEAFDSTDDLCLGMQLTHSGRFARPNDNKKLEPRTLYAHPVLDAKHQVDPAQAVLSDSEIDDLIKKFIDAAKAAWQLGFDFVDVKHCHGYLGHEFLSARTRDGNYGGSFENRTQFLREIVSGIRSEAPGLGIGVRLSAFDWAPFRQGESGIGEITEFGDSYPYAFGGDNSGNGIDLRETDLFLDLLASMDIELVCLTAGSPYYNPHIQRPALFPPSDGYLPPEDPLVGVARQIAVTAELKSRHPELCLIGSGYSYLQEFLAHVGQHVVRSGKADFIGLGRMVLSYPELPADVLAGKPMTRKKICRTFSDCTTGPRQGQISGCYPLDAYYKDMPAAQIVKDVKKNMPK